MNITLYSLITTVMWTSFFSLILLLCRRSTFFIRYCGIQALYIIYICILIRLFIPIELSMSRVVVLPNILNPIYDILNITISKKHEITILSIILIIWVFVAFIIIMRFTFLYFTHLKWLSRLPSITNEQIDRIAKDVICDKDRKKIKITLYSDSLPPMICGLNKMVILLPTIEYSDQELYIILQHEYTHFKNKDSYLMLILEVISSCFWWIPFVYLIKYELKNILEIKCDRQVIRNCKKREILLYTEIMLKHLTINTLKASKTISFMSSNFSSERAIKQRFKLLLLPNVKNKYQEVLSILITITLITIMMFSYVFVFQSRYLANYNFKMNNEMTYIEQNIDGTYTVYSEENNYIISPEHYEIMIANDIIINIEKERRRNHEKKE